MEAVCVCVFGSEASCKEEKRKTGGLPKLSAHVSLQGETLRNNVVVVAAYADLGPHQCLFLAHSV